MSIPLANRVNETQISGIRKVFDLAAKMKNPINLSIGQPDFPVPEAIKKACCNAINANRNSYSQTQGIPDLREALKLRHNITDGQLLITSAVSGGLLLSCLALLNQGDEILMPDPYFVMYKQLPLMLGAKPVFYDTFPNWKIDLSRIESLITPRTKAILVNSPNNPTGAVLTRNELSDLGNILRKHNLLAISDEIYSSFCYDSQFTAMHEVYPHTLTLSGFSKSHAITGWRLGYAFGPEELIAAMTKFQQFTFVCAPTMVQAAGVACLAYDVQHYCDEYREKRNIIYHGLIEAGYDVEKPGGAFYIFPKVPSGYASDDEFVNACIANDLLLIPSNVFSERNTHFRISYAASNETIERGLAVLKKLYKK